MKRTALFLVLFLAAAPALANTDAGPAPEPKAAAPALTEAQWKAFSDQLVAGLTSQHDHYRQAAMRLVIAHSEHVDVDAAVFEIVRIYRDHADERMRRMAVTTLAEMQHPWAMDFLSRSIAHEKSPTIKRHLQNVVASYRAG